jgi:hypothetical protein
MVIVRSSSLLGKITILVVIVLAGSVTTLGRTIYVDDDVPADFNNIQAAIDDANDGDIVEVLQGTYTGTGNRDIDFLGKAITVRSTNPQDPCVVASTVIDCQGVGRGFYFHSGEEANSILDGLKITNGYVTISSPGGSAGGGIYCGNQSEPTIANCDINGNTAIGNSSYPGGPPPSSGNGGGVYGCNGTIINCNIRGNTTSGDSMTFGRGGGLYECNGTIINCTISGNTAFTGGMYLGSGGGLYACDGMIENCTISGNSAEGGPGGLSKCNGTIINCTISRNQGSGLSTCNGTIINCSISGNTASQGGGLFYCNGTIANCTITV